MNVLGCQLLKLFVHNTKHLVYVCVCVCVSISPGIMQLTVTWSAVQIWTFIILLTEEFEHFATQHPAVSIYKVYIPVN